MQVCCETMPLGHAVIAIAATDYLALPAAVLGGCYPVHAVRFGETLLEFGAWACRVCAVGFK